LRGSVFASHTSGFSFPIIKPHPPSPSPSFDFAQDFGSGAVSHFQTIELPHPLLFFLQQISTNQKFMILSNKLGVCKDGLLLEEKVGMRRYQNFQLLKSNHTLKYAWAASPPFLPSKARPAMPFGRGRGGGAVSIIQTIYLSHLLLFFLQHISTNQKFMILSNMLGLCLASPLGGFRGRSFPNLHP
jgi:hypothetical protein